MLELQGKKISLAITGSIAAYKAVLLLRLLVKAGAEVRTLITPAGEQFIGKVTLSTLSGHAVGCDFFEESSGSWNSHVDMGLWSDLMVVAPASANTIAKMAQGIADNLVLTAYLSAKCPVLVAPAMDLDMYKHPSTQANINTLRSYGNLIAESGDGFLASGLVGKGRMQEPEILYQHIVQLLSTDHSLSDKKVLINAGPTYERIDPVRFIGNFSSGKMGFALAHECAKRGAEVTLVSGPVHQVCTHPRITRIDVVSAKEMYEACVSVFPQVDYAILCAAVADYSPDMQEQKIKKAGSELAIHLKETQDIAARIGEMKQAKQRVMGFALETENEVRNAKEKCERKGLDLIVLNSLQDAGAGFMTDTNKVQVISAQGEQVPFPLMSKDALAVKLIDALISL